jgi:hypothetical protein
LFGGQANITAAGYTYSEYARRGFGELVAVSVLTLALIMGLGSWGRRESARQRGWFNALSVLMVGLVCVILASALMRLLLYEDAYGFTRLRTYTHVAIFWMGATFLVFLVVLLARRLRLFAPLAGVCFSGFIATLGLLNVDAFIVRQNVQRLEETGKIDIAHLASLSSDAVPGLVELAGSATEDVRQDLLPTLACRRAELERREDETGLASFHLSHDVALRALHTLDDGLDDYPVRWRPYGAGSRWGEWMVTVDGVEESCWAGTGEM